MRDNDVLAAIFSIPGKKRRAPRQGKTWTINGKTFHVEPGRGRTWEGWFDGEDHTTLIADTLAELAGDADGHSRA